MGLDMYLRAESYVSGYEFSEDEERTRYGQLVTTMDAGEMVDPETPSATVAFTVAYWRKANQIHAWFVKNVQDGKDDCGSYPVEREQLQRLRALCQQVLGSLEMKPGPVHTTTSYEESGPVEHFEPGKVVADASAAEEFLPTQPGFFFGGTDYDEWYVRDLEDTIAQLDRVLATTGRWGFSYQSSW